VSSRLGGTKGAQDEHGIIYFSYGRGKENHDLGTGFCVNHGIVTVVKRVEFVSYRMSYIYIYIYFFFL